ncbi:MAG: hypothetical protein AB1351_01130 [Thermoproteota archaeon]
MQDRDFYESLDATLRSLGEDQRKLVITALESSGVPFRPGNIDIGSVDRVLFELFGIGSEALMTYTYSRLRKKMLIGFDDTEIANAVDKIRKWLEVTAPKTH